MIKKLKSDWKLFSLLSLFLLAASACDNDSQNVGSGPKLEDPRYSNRGKRRPRSCRQRYSGCCEDRYPRTATALFCQVLMLETGPELMDPRGIDVLGDGTIVVANAAANTILAIDPDTGDRSVLSGDGVGSGPPLEEPRDLALEADGNIVVKDRGQGDGPGIDVDTGDRVIISGQGVGTGPPFVTPRGIAVLPDGDLALADVGLVAILHIDRENGDHTIISDAETGTGPLFVAPTQIAVEDDGSLLVTDSDLAAVFRIDETTGKPLNTLRRPTQAAAQGLGVQLVTILTWTGA